MVSGSTPKTLEIANTMRICLLDGVFRDEALRFETKVLHCKIRCGSCSDASSSACERGGARGRSEMPVIPFRSGHALCNPADKALSKHHCFGDQVISES